MKRRTKLHPTRRRWRGGILLLGAVWAAGVAWGGGGLRRTLSQSLSDARLGQALLAEAIGPADWEEDQLDQVSRAVVNASPVLAAGVILETDEEDQVLETTEPTSTVPQEEVAVTPDPVPEESQVVATPLVTPEPVALDQISLTNRADIDVDLTEIAALDCTLDLSGSPQILIIHTHGTEAYTMEGADVYESSDTYRTTDENYNMIRVGEELAAVLTELGYSVVHDTTLYDYPSYNGSYARAKEGISWYLEQYPSICMVLDVHRDALITDDGIASKVVTTVSGEKTAQVMLVMGTDAGGLSHPNWKTNLSLALRVQQAMLGIESTLPRPINLRSSRFNQHMTTGSLLVEVGSCGNTLQEALEGVRYFGQALGSVLDQMC